MENALGLSGYTAEMFAIVFIVLGLGIAALFAALFLPTRWKIKYRMEVLFVVLRSPGSIFAVGSCNRGALYAFTPFSRAANLELLVGCDCIFAVGYFVLCRFSASLSTGNINIITAGAGGADPDAGDFYSVHIACVQLDRDIVVRYDPCFSKMRGAIQVFGGLSLLFNAGRCCRLCERADRYRCRFRA